VALDQLIEEAGRENPRGDPASIFQQGERKHMAEDRETVESIKMASDGTVKIAIEKYNELLETIASQKGSISSLRTQLNQARSEPSVINRTIVEKTPEMAAQDNRMWGGTLMGAGVAMFIVGALRFRAGRIGS